jgi:membrane associated rhomboid family serine protease
MTKPLIISDPDTGELATLVNPIIIHPPTKPTKTEPAPAPDPEPEPQTELEPEFGEELPLPFRTHLREFMVDGRAVIYSLCAAPIMLGAFMLYYLIRDIITVINGIIAASATIGGILLALLLGWILTRGSKGGDSLYLKGCPTRSPGVHKIQLCNRRH